MRVRAVNSFVSVRAGSRAQGEVFALDDVSASKLIAVGAVEPYEDGMQYRTKVIVREPVVPDLPKEGENSLPLESGQDAPVSSPPPARRLRQKTRKRWTNGEAPEEATEGLSP